MTTFLRPETLLRMALDAEAAGRTRYAARCWATLTHYAALAEVPGDELQRIYAAACANGQPELAKRSAGHLAIRLRDSAQEPLVSHVAR